MMWLRIFLLLFILGFIDIGYTSAKRLSSSLRFGNSRSSSSHRISKPTLSSSGGYSSRGHVSASPNHEQISSINSKPLNTGYMRGSAVPHQQSNKDINTPFLHGEGGGATKPKTDVNHQTSNIGFNANAKPPSPYTPSAPIIPIHDSKPLFSSAPSQAPSFGHSGTHVNQGSGIPTHQSPIGFKPDVYPNNNSPIGFKPSVYPNNNFGSQPSHPHNPPYPSASMPYPSQTIPHSNPGSPFIPPMSQQPFGGHSMNYPQGHGSFPVTHNYPLQSGVPHYPNMQTSHPMNNHYAPGGYAPGGYGSGPAFYPQQQGQYLAQPAAQPYIPGQTVLMVPGQQSSGRGFGDMIKEALVFSTINAGVNRLINPHQHYYEPKPSGTEGSTGGSTGTTTHITYNNQYFNNYPVNGTNGTMDPQNMGSPPNPMYNPTGSNPQQNSAIPIANSGIYYPPSNIPGISDGNNVRSPNQLGVTGVSTVTKNDTNLYVQGNDSNKQINNTTANTADIYQYIISDNDLYKISEDLFAQEEHNLTKYIIMNLQARSNPGNVTDVAERQLLYVQSDAYNILTIKVIRMLYENYERNSSKKENRTFEKRMEENIFLDVILNTNVMHTAMKWLSSRGFIDPDDFERKDILRHIWFTQFHGTSSGFERVFASEVYGDTDILGVQDWIYFNHEESSKNINYMGYVDKMDLGNKASLVKLNFNMNGITRPNVTIFVGTTPELEMALYTICFYARPNNLCPVSLGNTTFNIYTHAFRYFGKDLIDLALPII
ncbi:AT-rich interactive domain-containing protein 1A-like [Vespa crabro]|uniref:AT-rich interactive domain-containing protein 1A-like n=1 Tax=Vespa crabro TaxID=7445 RepID=UPI001F00CC93|nr:AT-rich interactive domain-containing protein 1A-like [Vespa crabro]